MDEEKYRPRASTEFVETTVLDTFIPAYTQTNVEDLLSRTLETLGGNKRSPLSHVAQRADLLFGKNLCHVT